MLDDTESILKVRAFHTSIGDLADLLQMHGGQLRQDQCRDFAKSYQCDLDKVLPKGLTKPQSCITSSQLPILAKKHVEEQEAKLKEKQALETLLPAGLAADAESQLAQPQHEVEEKEEEEEEDNVIEATGPTPAFALPSEMQSDAKKRSKQQRAGKSAGKGAGGTGKAGSVAGSKARDHGGQAPSIASASSSKTRAKLTHKEKLLNKALSWRQTLHVPAVLDGAPLGTKVWGSRQTLTALEKISAGDMDVVLLKSHVELLEQAQVTQS